MEQDDRFKHVNSDPKFRRLPQKDRKVKIDKRFQTMFKDPRFNIKSQVDKRGRPVTFASSENYKKFYELTSSEEDDSDEEDEPLSDDQQNEVEIKSKKKPKKNAEDDEQHATASDDASEAEENSDKDEQVLDIDDVEKKVLTTSVREKLKDLSVDYARGGGQIFSDSSSSEEETSDDDGNDEIEHAWGELDKDSEKTDEATVRIAVCNMDWNRVRSDDLMVLLNSFVPAGGTIKKVAVYQSEFGKQCMKEEEVTGPKELAEQTADETGEDNFDQEKLRVYEMRRLRYFYAVVECDSVDTASHIYDECDGLEFESSAAKIDLRFIPDDLTFDEDPRDECKALPEAGKYIPQHFATSALTQSNFELTWDETDPRRKNLNKKLWATKDKELDENVLQDYLASSSGEESDDEGTSADKYRALLQCEDKDDGNKEMEITWGIDLQNKVDKKANEKLRKDAGLGELTPFEEMMQKKKDKKKQKRLDKISKKKENSSDEDGEQVPFSDDELPSDAEDIRQQLTNQRDSSGKKGKKKGKKGSYKEEVMDEKQKAELELLTMDEDNEKHFNFNSRLPKKAQTEDDFLVDVKDPRFSAIYTSHHFNLDPSNHQFKDNKSTQAFVAEKLRFREAGEKPQVDPQATKLSTKKSSGDVELNRLIKNVKRKAEENQQRRVKSKKMS